MTLLLWSQKLSEESHGKALSILRSKTFGGINYIFGGINYIYQCTFLTRKEESDNSQT
jgi:hypothetical protein